MKSRISRFVIELARFRFARCAGKSNTNGSAFPAIAISTPPSDLADSM